MRELIAGFILLGLASGPATGQAKDQSDVTRSIIQAERRSIVAATMQLDYGQAALFWPLYDAYRDEVGLVNERTFKLLDDYAAAYPTLNDDQAARLLDEWLDIERDTLDIRHKWARRFGRRLPARVVARFFQLDSRLDTVVRAELAKVVPLAR